MFRSVFVAFLVSFCVALGETFEEVLNESLKNSYLLKQKLYQVKALEGNIISAKALNNPEVSIEFGRLYSQTDSGVALTAFSIQQQLRLWGERKFAKEAAVLQKKSSEFMFKSFINSFSGEIYKKFYEGLYKKELIKAKKQELELLKQLHSFLKKSYELGESVLLDILQVEKDIQIVSAQLENLKTQYKKSLQEISVYTGRKVEDIQGDFYLLKDIKDTDIQKLPSLVLLDYMEQSLEKQIKRQKALSKPQISLGLTAEEDPVDLGKYEFGVSLSSTIPVFYKRQGEILSLVYQKKAVLSQKKQVLLETQAKVQSLKNQYQVLKNQIQKIKTETLKKIEKALKLAEESYKLGAISFFEYSSVRKQYFETLVFKNQLVNQAHQIYGDYLKIVGIKEGGLK